MMEGPCADSEEKREPAGDIDTVVVVDGLKVLDPKRPIREADIARLSRISTLIQGFALNQCSGRELGIPYRR
jgi:hypothetical protein